MLRKVLLTLVVLVAAVLGLATFALTQGAALPGRALPALPAKVDRIVQANDSAGLASFAIARCRLLWRAERQACYEDLLLQLVKQDRVRLSLGALNLLGQRDPQVRRFGHDYSHVIGINAWVPGKDIGAVYVQCSELFQSGCYHGVIQAYFANTGTDSGTVSSLCRDTPGIARTSWLRFQCVHGIGHGLVQAYTMNLPHALAGCDMLGNAWDSESCYGGAFMEFIVGGRGQSHHPHMVVKKDSAAAGGEMDHSKMDHGDMGPAATADSFPPFKVRDPNDLLYPCSVLGQRYQRACYQMQAGLVVERTGLDFAKVAAVCDTAPEESRKTCYQGIGTYVSGVTSRDTDESIRLCSLGSARYQPWCFIGVVKNFVDVTANPEDGLAFCLKVGPVGSATACYVAVGEEASVLYISMDKRAAVCAKADPKYADACRYGAGVTRVRPAALPTG